MKSILKKIFTNNWQRKILALTLAIITWFFVNHSLIRTKIVEDVPIKVINLPKGRIISLQNGLFPNKVSLEIIGNQKSIEAITKKDLEVIIDLKHTQKDKYTTLITKENLISKNPYINIDKSIKNIKPQEINIHLSKHITEKIPLLITQPTGNAPQGYQFLDIWPCKLYVTINGPMEIIKNLKTTGLKLAFDLSLISQKELDIIDRTSIRGKNNVISFFIPTNWKKITIPEISSSTLEIDDPIAKSLRIDFVKKEFIAINFQIPIELYFPPSTSKKLNPNNITIENNDFVKKINGINMINIPLFVYGMDESFIDALKDRIHIIILIEPNEGRESLKWNIQPIFPSKLQKKFVKNSKIKNEKEQKLSSYVTDEYLMNRFKVYLKELTFWISPEEKLNLNITLKDNKVTIINKQL
jgi:hypothetical protein